MNKLSKFLIAIGTAVTATAAMSTVQAATYPLGTFTPGIGQVIENVGTGNFTDTYTFQVAEPSNVGGEVDNLPLSLTFNSITTRVLNITGLSLSLWGPSGKLAWAPGGSSLHFLPLATGVDYSLVATGDATGVAGGTYALAYNVSSVPIPGALYLFSMSIAGLVGIRLRKHAATTP